MLADLRSVFGGVVVFARCRIAAIMAKASMTSETWRCHPCQERVSLWSSPNSFFALSKLSSIPSGRIPPDSRWNLDDLRPAMPLDLDQHLDARSGRAPGGEEGHIPVGDVAADQQAARPPAGACVIVFGSIEIGQFAIDPIVQPRALRAVTRRQALPSRRIERAGDLLGRPGTLGRAGP